MEVKGSKIQACCPYYNHILLYRKQNTLLTIISNHKTEITEPKHYHRVRSGKKSRGNNNTLCHNKNDCISCLMLHNSIKSNFFGLIFCFKFVWMINVILWNYSYVISLFIYFLVFVCVYMCAFHKVLILF